jgi:DivIVA domain-containing protein
MAQEPDAEKRGSVIALAGKRKWGYDTAQVDAFLEKAHALYESDEPRLGQGDIQNVSFELVMNGYVIAQVDAALARLERAVVDKRTTWEINQHGRVAWRAQTESMFKKYSEHAQRAHKERFKLGKSKQPSYKCAQVDRLIDQITKKLSVELSQQRHSDEAKDLVDLNAKRVSNVIFTQYRGKRGYDERQVDYFLNYAVQLLSRVESYARLNEYVSSEDASADADASTALGQDSQTTGVLSSGADAGVGETQVVAPLFDMSARGARAEDGNEASAFAVEPFQSSFGSETAQQDDDFHRLNAAERAIFQSSDAVDGSDGNRNSVDRTAADRTTPDSESSSQAHPAQDGTRPDGSARSDVASDDVPASAPEQESGTRGLNDSLSFRGSANASLAALAQTQPVQSAVPEGYGAQQDNSETQLSGAVIRDNGNRPASEQSGPSVEDAATERFDPLNIQGAEQPRSWQPQQASSSTSHPAETATSGYRGSAHVEHSAGAAGGLTPDKASAVTSDAQRAWDTQPSTPPDFSSAVPQSAAVPESATESDLSQGAQERSTAASEKQSQDPDQYLAKLTSLLDSSTFPKVDLDIPDLSFPGFDEGNGTTDASKAQDAKR